MRCAVCGKAPPQQYQFLEDRGYLCMPCWRFEVEVIKKARTR